METNIQKSLGKYDKEKVEVFLNYLNTLKTEKDKGGTIKNFWATKLTDNDYINVFKKEAEKGLYIDGESITLTFRGKLMVTYDYHAYINKIKLTYPESIFDFGIVYEGDDFSFRKDSGVVNYTHKLNNPFKTDKTIVGAYGVIKNKKGEFLETINMSDIQKMKNTSLMKNIWDSWFDRMVLKSVIKRVCSVHFKDIVNDMEKTDYIFGMHTIIEAILSGKEIEKILVKKD